MAVPSSQLPLVMRLLALAPLLAAVACASPRALPPGGDRAYYQTAFPAHDTSRELERLFGSVKQAVFSADYRRFLFAEETGVTDADVQAGTFRLRADSIGIETVSKAGTATVVARSFNRITLLSTDHLARFPELEVEYWDEPPGRAEGEPRRVASVAVKTAERGTLVPPGGTSPLRVLARDEANDLALLSATLGELGDTVHFQPLEVPAGDARRLSWGSFVYVVGFPRSTPMVTRAIVSNPDRDGRGGFVTDGLWNEGISGGLILGVRGSTGRLELVGVARAGVGEREVQLRPDTTRIPGEHVIRRYEGPIYLQTTLRIRYGITLPISMVVINEFLRRNRVTLRGG